MLSRKREHGGPTTSSKTQKRQVIVSTFKNGSLNSSMNIKRFRGYTVVSILRTKRESLLCGARFIGHINVPSQV